jgi:hypothetical protein
MERIEKNTLKSFRLVKSDIVQLQNKVIELNQIQKKLIENIELLHKKADKLSKKPSEKKSKPLAKTIKKTFVAAKSGKKFHIRECPFAKNIMPKSRITFKTKITALNNGYKPCNCVK